jgi:hypothetical protein
VEYLVGTHIPSFTLVTNKGTKSTKFGTGTGTPKTMTFPDGYDRIVGILGKSQDYVDSLGFVLAKTTYPNSGESG